jgi:zinc transporter ZupT
LEGQFWSVTLYGSLAGLATLAGIFIVLTREAWARRSSIYLISFASGTLLSASLLDILPLHAGLTRAEALAYSIIVALATPVGAMVSYGALQGIRADILGGLLGIAAGSLLYIAASDLIPETHRQSSPYNILLVISGMALLFVLELAL